MRVDAIWQDARLMTMTGPALGEIDNAIVAVQSGRIVYAGPAADAPALDAARVTRCDGRWISPGLIDCHTHLVFGGNRSAEFEARRAGASYAELAAIGGIRATVAATRAATDATLLSTALHRLDAMIADGITTIEIKSGYGLNLPTELRQLTTARALPTHRQIRVSTSLLAAHALPPEFTDSDAYIDHIIADILPAAHAASLADAVDAFCETIAFTPTQIDRLFTAARTMGLPVRLHADQLTDSGGAALAAHHQALSADHLEYTSQAGIAAMASAGTIAVLLPGAYYALRERQRPPIAALRAANIPIAVATDCNPGTSPLTSPLLAMNMAATLFDLTVDECLRGMTRHAAAALARPDLGTLAPGQHADLAIWSIEHPAELVYWLGAHPLWHRESAA